MQRFVYTPRVEAYIKLQSGRIIDISDEIISGSVSLRLNAMSEAELTLQNKHGRFVRVGESGSMIAPMDQIVIKMSRVGKPENVFAGFIDEAPHYQLYSGPVTIRASCILKLLQHTYFDPGLMAMGQMFYKYGWQYDGTESLKNQMKKWDAIDSTGSVKDLIRGMLIDVANWPIEMIQIQDLPASLIKDLGKIITAEDNQWNDDYDRVIKKLQKLFAIDSSASIIGSDVGGMGPGGAAVPVKGKVPIDQVAQMLKDEGFPQDAAAALLAIAFRESNYVADAVGINDPASDPHIDPDYVMTYDLGLFQINSKNLDERLVHLAPPPSGTGSGTSEKIAHLPKEYQDIMSRMFDPHLAVAKAKRMYDSSGLNPWAYGSPRTWENGITADEIQQGKEAAQRIYSGAKVPDPQIPGPDESEKPTTTSIADNVLKIAYAQVGNHGTGDNRGPEIQKYFTETGYPIGYAWCAAFAAWVFLKAGYDVRSRIGGNFGSVEAWYAWGQSTGNIVTTPRPGDVALYGNNQDHIGIVIKVKNGQYQQVDGNSTGDAVTFDGWRDFSYASSFVRFPEIGTASPDLDIEGPIGDVTGGSGGVAGTTLKSSSLSPGAVRDIAAQTFFGLSIGGFDQIQSTMLTGERALSNDISLMEWMTNIITGAGRVFTSDANGYFRAFYPDYFGFYGGQKGGQTPTFYIAEIEILDLTIQQNDRDLTTHVFGTGPVSSWGAGGLTIWDRLFSTVASVEHPAFDWFLAIDEKANFDKIAFLKRYGARPYNHDMPFVLRPELLWMGSWMKFLEFWSRRFATNASFTFMPEIRPGFLLNIGNRIQMFVNGVTHSFNFTSGFTTTAELTSAATLTDDITWLPRAGRSSVIDGLPAFTDPPDDLADVELPDDTSSPEDIPEGSPIHPR